VQGPPSAAPTKSPDSATAGASWSGGAGWWVAAALVFAASTTWMFLQPLRPDPMEAADGWDWFAHPVERNGFLRLQRMTRTLHDVCVVQRAGGRAAEAWAVGDGGFVVHSSDAGATWERQPTPTNADLSAVCMLADGNGWAVGAAATALTTTDGGQNWKAVEVRPPSFSPEQFDPKAQMNKSADAATVGPAPMPRWFKAVWFENSKHGWILNSTDGESVDALFITDDGGKSWRLNSAQDEVRKAVDDPSHESARTRRAGSHRGEAAAYLDDSAHVIVGDAIRFGFKDRTGARVAMGGSTSCRVDFVDAEHGWFLADSGTLLATSDGGMTWDPVRRPSPDLPRRPADADDRRQTRTPGPPTGIRAIDLLSPRSAAVVEFGGDVFITADGGRTWDLRTPQYNGASVPATDVAFATPTQGCVCTADGGLFSTSDGGATWSHALTHTLADLRRIGFADQRHGWAVGEPQELYPGERVKGAVERRGPLLLTSNGGANWSIPDLDGVKGHVKSAAFVDARRGWVLATSIDGRDEIWSTTSSGESWSRREPPKGVSLRTLVASVPGGPAVCGVGEEGVIVAIDVDSDEPVRELRRTADGVVLSDLRILDEKTGYAVGSGMTFLATSDDGKTWTAPMLPWSRRPAPWYYLACALSGVFCLVAVRRRPEPAKEPDSVADTLASDRPLEAGDPDAMDLAGIAAGLSRFFRNENTQPPLTVAITGPWGSGKSSLMNLVRADLTRHGARPVWFNAWHHQSEDQILPALLEQIRREAVPSWWRPEAWIFRMNLLRLRGWRRMTPFLLVAAAIALSLGLIAGADPEGRLRVLDKVADLGKWVHSLFATTEPNVAPVAPDGAPPAPAGNAASRVGALALLASTAALVRGLWAAFTAFGVSPSVLVKGATGGFATPGLRSKAGFRERFAKEFGDVTKALGRQRLAIFIDDLDRCRPKHVLEVLETVNFLVSTGECFVVMGLAAGQVRAAVGLGFKEVADEMVRLKRRTAGKNGEDPGRARRAKFARKYLEKLINMEVPVPRPTAEQSAAVLVGAVREEERRPSVWARCVRPLAPFAPFAAVVVVCAAAFWAGTTLTERVPEPPTVAKPAAVVEATPTTTTEAPLAKPKPSTTPDGTAPATISSSPGALIAPQTEPSGALIVLLLLPLVGLLIGVGWWVLTRRPDLVVKDSPTFAEALRVWHPVVALRHPTPRSLKRFKNRLRYLAMRQRVQAAVPSVFATIRAALRRLLRRDAPAAPPALSTDAIPEATLVALAARAGTSERQAAAVAAATQAHEAKFGKVDAESFAARFAALTTGVRMN
jgi:photosystem II stability/assembly factor-like uncharacterized protein